ncbi:MAG: phosphonate C-P lyase system protein PhnH [Actinomycetota bacterium]
MAAPILTGAPSQLAFDAILRSLSEPGTIRQLPPAPGPDVPAAAMVALALGDIDLGVSVDNDPAHPVAQLLRAATGVDIVEQSGAHFVVCTDGAVPVGEMRTGTALVPEDGARLTIAVSDLATTADLASTVVLSGPGVPGERLLSVDGGDAEALLALGQASGEFPAGVDTWLVTPDGRIAAISRSTTVTSTTTEHKGDR